MRNRSNGGDSPLLDVANRSSSEGPVAFPWDQPFGTHPAWGTDAATIAVPGLDRPIRVKVATEPREFTEAFAMLSRNYRARGYEQPSPKLLRFTPYHVLPDTRVLVATAGGQVLATLSLVPDTVELQLPLDNLYGAEMARLRDQGRRLAEFTSLAADGLSRSEFLPVFMTMIRLGKQFHVRRGGDTFVMTVNPRHRRYYCKALGYEPLGPRRAYPAVGDHPAEAFMVDVAMMRDRTPAAHDEIFGTPLSDAVLSANGWSPELVRDLGRHSTLAEYETILELLAKVEEIGCPPRWLEARPAGRLVPADSLVETDAEMELCPC